MHTALPRLAMQRALFRMFAVSGNKPRTLATMLFLASTVATIVDAVAYTRYTALNCYAGHGGLNIDNSANHTTKSEADCTAYCDATAHCYCVVHQPKTNGCWRRAACVPAQCIRDGKYETYVKPGAPPLPPPAPTPPKPIPYPDHTPLGPPCADCPNIVFSITHDQDLLLGGWENHGPTNPMRQTQELVAVLIQRYYIHYLKKII